MSLSVTDTQADRVISLLCAHERELRQAGITRLSVFGSIARNDADEASDIDLAAEFDPACDIDLIKLSRLEMRLEEVLERRVEILLEPVENKRLRANIARDRRVAF